jgi:small-conductance mechanosensitive channel
MTHGYLYDLLRKLGLTDFGASTGEFLLEKPVRILLTLLVASILVRVAVRGTRRFVNSVHRRTPSRLLSVRAEQRMTTIADALASLVRVVIWVVALLLVLDEVNVNLAPLLAGAGIAGVAIGFGAQSLVKDYISGLFILVEDQYGVGDVVTVGEATGTVEDLNLRVTRVRAVDGTVYFVPNGEIRKVGNSSMEWSRALLDTAVGGDADVAAVSAAIAEEATGLAGDPQFRDVILDEPEVWGVQSMTPDGVTIRLTVKTAPRQQWLVARELRTRIAARLRRDGVPGPGGKGVTVSAGPLDQGAPVAIPLGVVGR